MTLKTTGGAALLVLGALLVGVGMHATRAQAQSLDDQYTFYLTGKCKQLGFARDAEAVLLPGQAGPHLQAFCSGPVAVGGGGGTTSQGGGAAQELSTAGEEQERALQRRRGRLSDSKSDPAAAADAASESELASFGATSVFFSFDYLHERQTQTEFESGRHSSGFGALLGIDHRFGYKGLAGIAARYLEQSGDLDSGGDFAAHSPGFRVYGSWLPAEGWFIDGAVGYDRKSLDTQRIVALRVETFGSPGHPPNISFNPPPLPAGSSTHEDDTSVELHTGYDFSFSSLTIGPRAGILLTYATLEPYTESGDTPMTLAIAEQNRTSLRSVLGFQATNAFNLPTGALIPQLNLEWLHEYRDDQRKVSAHFAEDLRPNPVEFQFLNNPPDRDWFVVRVSTVAVFSHGLNAFAAFERTVGNLYFERYRATLGIRWEL